MSGEVDSIVAAALASAEPKPINPGQRYLVLDPTGGHDVIEPAADKYLDAPRRALGTSVVYDVDSMGFLWTKHASAHSELFADDKAFTITGVLNADEGSTGNPGFRDHRVEFRSVLTPAWVAWALLDGKMLSQADFAEHIEDRVIDIVSPTGAEMLDLAQHFEATTKVDFESADRLGDGQRRLVYKETVQAKAGQTGEIVIPEKFTVGLQPFEGGDAYRITARLRYRISGGNLQLGYKFERPEDVLRTAFTDRMTAVSEATGQTVLRGVAPATR